MRAIPSSLISFIMMVGVAAAGQDYPIQPVPFTSVEVDDAFWTPRLETNLETTVPHDLEKCEQTGRIRNFAIAGGLAEGDFRGHFGFDDTDVYKVIEGASYSLELREDDALQGQLQEIIAKISAAQEDDGYLYTPGTIPTWADEPYCCFSRPRWADLRGGHELYNLGHLYEAAVAHHQATGERSLLDVALRSADLVGRVFGPEGSHGVPGHQEIEVGLVRLYRSTGEPRYLELARFFLDQRGRSENRDLYGAYNQDHVPVIEQREAVGHAVRAGYMYSAMADIGALTGDGAYVEALDGLWQNVVSKKLYLTGGIGARHDGEAFGEDYELPNRTAYAETCAAIANAMWNHRLFLLHGDAKYLDVLERVLYNGFLSGVSLDGENFFYPNPLAADGEYEFNRGKRLRSPWFDCSCCPSNVVRFMPSIPGYVYAQRDRELFVNLFVAGTAELEMDGSPVRVRQATRYPWEGKVVISVEAEGPDPITLMVRIPGWAQGRPVPSDLYRYSDDLAGPAELVLNGQPVPLDLQQGFARIHRAWQKGDILEVDLPMSVRRVVSHEKVEANTGRVALERGPIVYCGEAIDNGGRVSNLVLPDEVALAPEHRDELLGGVTVLTARALSLHVAEDGRSVITKEQPFQAVPYYAWAHRGAGEMAVWLPRRVSLDFRIP